MKKKNKKPAQDSPDLIFPVNEVNLSVSNNGKKLFVIDNDENLTTFSLEGFGVNISILGTEEAGPQIKISLADGTSPGGTLIPDKSIISIGNTFNGIFFDPFKFQLGVSGLGTTEIFSADPVFLGYYSVSFSRIYARDKSGQIETVKAQVVNISYLKNLGNQESYWEIYTFFETIKTPPPLDKKP